MQIVKESVTESDLALVNRFTLKPLTQDQVEIYSGTFADEQPNANKRIYTREWQAQYFKDFVGSPITTNHEVTVEASYGRVIEARQDAGSIKGRFYIAKTKEGADKLIDALDSGAVKGISIEAFSKAEPAGEFARIVPDPLTKILAVSLVGVAACKSCEVTRESAESPEKPAATDRLREFASEAVKALKNEAVKLSALVLGKGNDRAVYQRVAESLSSDPFTLQEFVTSLKTAHAEQRRSDVQQPDLKAPVDPDGLTRALQAAQQLNKSK